MNKKLLALLLALTMMLTLAACGADKEDQDADEKLPTEEIQPEEPDEAEEPGETPDETPEEEAQPEETEDPAQPEEKPETKPETTPAEKPAQPAAPTQKPAEKPAQPETKPEEKPAESESVDLSAFYTSVTGGGNWPALMQMEGESLEAFYPGLSAVKTKQCAAYTAMISAAVGEIALVEVENAADVQTVKDIFQARINYQVGDDQNPGGAWYPASIEGWKNGSRIVSNGNYIMLVALSEGADDVVNSFNALFA